MRGALAGGVVAILRGRRAEHLDAVLGVLVEAGIRSLEIERRWFRMRLATARVGQ